MPFPSTLTENSGSAKKKKPGAWRRNTVMGGHVQPGNRTAVPAGTGIPDITAEVASELKADTSLALNTRTQSTMTEHLRLVHRGETTTMEGLCPHTLPDPRTKTPYKDMLMITYGTEKYKPKDSGHNCPRKRKTSRSCPARGS